MRRVAARALFKALAYKDEYEVARLLLARPNAGAKVIGKVRRYYYLAPPIFGARDAATGKPRKFKMPGWAIEPVFRLLRSLKWLRGGPLDVFAYSEERKQERALAADCLAMVRAIGDRGATVDKEAATHDLNLLLEVKGFGHVKQRGRTKGHPLSDSSAISKKFRRLIRQYNQVEAIQPNKIPSVDIPPI